jgi:N-ethylmaleimide reductase
MVLAAQHISSQWRFCPARLRDVRRFYVGERCSSRFETRSGSASPLAVEYYAQRASLGMLITEGTQPSADGQGYLHTPGIYTRAHAEGWRAVADAVHAGA